VGSKSALKKRPYNALAFAYYKRGDYGQAAAVLEDGMRRIPNSDADLGDTLATMYLKQGRYDKAIELFQKEVQAAKGEQLSVSYNNLGMAYLYVWTDLQNRPTQVTAAELDSRKEDVLKPAADAFSKSLAIAPDAASTLDNYINAMCWRGRGAEVEAAAAARLKASEHLDSGHLTQQQTAERFSDLYAIAKVAFNGDDYAKADIYFTEAEKIRNDVKILFFHHGYALTALKQEDRAIEKYIQAIRVEPIFIEAHNNLGLLYMNRQDYAKAIESFTEVLRLEPKYVSAHLNLASIYASQGKRELAREHLSTVLAESPGNQKAMAIAQQFGL
jgi:tetratricopeptide (TPR) repeat protein